MVPIREIWFSMDEGKTYGAPLSQPLSTLNMYATYTPSDDLEKLVRRIVGINRPIISHRRPKEDLVPGSSMKVGPSKDGEQTVRQMHHDGFKNPKSTDQFRVVCRSVVPVGARYVFVIE